MCGLRIAKICAFEHGPAEAGHHVRALVMELIEELRARSAPHGSTSRYRASIHRTSHPAPRTSHLVPRQFASTSHFLLSTFSFSLVSGVLCRAE